MGHVFSFTFPTFSNSISINIQHFISKVFLRKKIISNKFARWRHHSVNCLFRLWMHFCGFFGSKFPSFFNIVCLTIYRSNSSHRFARWRHRYICRLYSFFGRICAFRCVLRMYPPKTPCFYTRVSLELSQLLVTLDCISTRKLSLFCLSNIVFYRL